MLGAIYGDKAGSIYEYNELSEIKPVYPDELIVEDSFYSDDTIETIAICDAIINNKDYKETLVEYINEFRNYKPDFKPYFKYPFSPHTLKCAKGEADSESHGNGAMMRISPVGFLFDQEDEIIKNTYYATKTSHNSKEAIECSTIIALMIYYFRKGLSKKEVFYLLDLPFEYEPFKKFNTTCEETINNCLYAIYYSNSFEDAIRKILAMGGDTDTNACIVGSVAESIYQMTDKEKK